MRYSAETTRRFVTVNGTPYMAQRMDWEMRDGRHLLEYSVWEQIPSYMGDHSTVTSTEDGQGWGLMRSRFHDADFAHLKSWSNERLTVVRAYKAILEATEREIARIAFPEIAANETVKLV